uniref:RGM_C domain-containing protein n=1 Tax=Globodera pallida TaxID=36090 RepID=A0A183C2U7_GLOPA
MPLRSQMCVKYDVGSKFSQDTLDVVEGNKFVYAECLGQTTPGINLPPENIRTALIALHAFDSRITDLCNNKGWNCGVKPQHQRPLDFFILFTVIKLLQ